MASRHTEGKVRDFKLTKEDAARLAECLNSFDDSDSWPGGFTRGNPFTAERIIDDLSKRRKIRIIVAYSGDKIVGHCDVVQGDDSEAGYVGLLGADPKYQGQGYGKALLIEAAETAARHGLRRLDLHTWGGNLKALPLYKRTGYNWRPGTRVLMESYIPGILNSEMFKEFFERHYWYDSYKREIAQEVDDIVEDGIGVYKYHFEGENGDALDVTVDREAKGICGFSLTLDGKTIEADVRPAVHTGLIGTGENPVQFTAINNSGDDLPLSVVVNPTKHFTVDLKDDTSITVANSETLILDGTYSIEYGAEHIDREHNPDEKVRTQAEWSVTIGDKSIDLFSGIVAREAITLSSGPMYPVLAPGQTNTITLGLKNNTSDTIKGVAILSPISEHKHLARTIEFSLSPDDESEFALEVAADGSESQSPIAVEIAIYVNEGSDRTLVNKRTYSIPIIGASGAAAYEGLNDHFILENETVRFLLKAYPPHAFRGFQYKDLGLSYTGEFLLPKIGYPFPTGSTEWDKKRFEIRTINKPEYAALEMEAESEERPGMIATFTYKLHRGRDYLEFVVRLRNTSTTAYENLGIRVGGWLPHVGSVLYVPMRGDIYKLDSPEWAGGQQLSKKPEDYHESWCATTISKGNRLIGYVWDSDDLVEIHPRRAYNFATIESKLPDLRQGETVEKTVTRMVIGHGSWENVRALWARLSGRPTLPPEPIETRSDMEAELVATSCKQIRKGLSPVVLDTAKANKMELRVRVLHDNPIKVNGILRLPDGVSANGKQEIPLDFDVGIDKPYALPVNLEVDEVGGWLRKGGSLELRFPSRVDIIQFVVVAYDSKAEVKRESEVLGEKELQTLTAGGVQIAASPDYIGSLVRFGYEGLPSILYDTFPDANPLMWWDHVYTGMAPLIMGWSVWDWQTGYHKERWTVRDYSSGPWVGFELESVLKHCPGLKGMTFRLRYAILPGVPIVHMIIMAKNTSGMWKRVRFGFWGYPRINDKPQFRMHTVRDGRRITYEPTENEADIPIDPDGRWAAFEEPESGQVLGTITTCSGRQTADVENMGAQAQKFFNGDWRDLDVKASSSLSQYLVITSDPEDVSMLTGLSADIE